MTTARIWDSFQGNRWFCRLPDDLQRELIQHSQIKSTQPGHWLYGTGDEAHGLYGVLSGSVMTYIILDLADDEEANVPINISGPGTIFGYAAQMLGGKRATTAVAREKSEIFFVPQHALTAIAQKTPSLWLYFAELATEQLTWAARIIAERTRLSPDARIASRLHVYIQTLAMGDNIISIRQDELAELTGLSRKSVNQALQTFERRNILKTGYGSITVLDRAALEAEARMETPRSRK